MAQKSKLFEFHSGNSLFQFRFSVEMDLSDIENAEAATGDVL